MLIYFRCSKIRIFSGNFNDKFTVEYDVDHKSNFDRLRIVDDYFVHSFTPESFSTIPKHVVFVLDVSGSMSGTNIKQVSVSVFALFLF